MRLLAWIFLILGSYFIGIGQRLSTEAYGEWSELLAKEMLNNDQ